MARNNRPGSIQETIARVYKANGGLENCGRDTGVSVQTLSYATSADEARPGGLGVNYLDRLCRIEHRCAEPVAEHFARLANGHFLPSVDEGVPLHGDLSKLMQAFAAVVQQHAEAHSDLSEDPADYTPAEARKQVAEVEKILRCGSAFLAALHKKAGAGR
ncbi:hypothetical protein FGG78_19835 [Thioclava sp. BHET1]|nr:hypothetical protein FGG78_19835 [Thioclava sp. BHET1]